MSYIIWAIIIISVLRAIFSSDPKKKPKNQRPRNRAAADTGSGGRPSLDEVTRRKRQELQELARQQRGAQASAGGDVDPGNMTMAERIARARAKQQYEQRAAQAGQGRQAAPQSQPLPSAQRQAPARGPSGGRAGAGPRQERAEALRRKMEARRQQQQQAQARRQQQIQQAKAQRSAPARQPRPATGQVPRGQNLSPQDQVHRRVSNADQSPMKIGSARRQAEAGSPPAVTKRRANAAGLNFAKLSQADLRRAFILKEVLDRPVAERDPLAGSLGG